jgi:hypothetical protein
MRSSKLFGWQRKECVKPGCVLYGKKFADTYLHKRPDAPPPRPCDACGRPMIHMTESGGDWLECINKRCVENGCEYVPIAGTCSRCGRPLLRSVSDGKHFGECVNLLCARMGIRVPVRAVRGAGRSDASRAGV